jgi:GH25 family lysozyme M1 (1,4-beta-N-acetylmuramidase)
MTSFVKFVVRLFDVSHWQDNADTPYKPIFKLMIEAGFMGVMIRVGWGLVQDRMFKYFWALAKGMLDRIPYWYLDYYSYKGTGLSAYDWGVEQAEQCWDFLKADPGQNNLMLDCEEYGGAWRITLLNRGEYRQVMKGFIERWHQLTGSRPVIYCSPGFFWVFEDWVKSLDLWLALYNRTYSAARVVEYAREKGWKGRILFWQYTSDGDINDDGKADGRRLGFETDTLDLNVWLGTVEEYSRYVGENVTRPQPAPAEDEGTSPPVVLPAGSLTVVAASGLNIRDVPIGKAGSQVVSWMARGTVVTPKEVLQVGNDVWARVDDWTCAAVKYNNVEMMK